LILCLQEERRVGNDNTVKWRGLSLQIPPSSLRAHFVRATVRAHIAARAWKAGNLHVLGLHLHLRSISSRQLSASTEDPTRPHVGKAEGH
jgi:hypothetical protein